MDELVISVFELNKYVADKLDEDPLLCEVWVLGEVSGASISYGTLYFTLKDEQSAIECMMFDADSVGANAQVIAEGRKVMVRGSATVYWKSGRYRFLVREIVEAGMGELMARFNEIKERLAGRGVFDLERKKPLPAYPRKIGIVTSKNGAALRDIMNIISRRDESVKLCLYAVRVQGDMAPGEIVRGIEYFNENKELGVDLLIVGRGGGSAEDLFAFNDEAVVMAVHGSALPVISAVGHETDFTLCDMAADLRAPTPSAAAEMAVPQKEDILAHIGRLRAEQKNMLCMKLDAARMVLKYSRSRLSKDVLLLKVAAVREKVKAEGGAMRQRVRTLYMDRKTTCRSAAELIEGLSPYNTFKRGYAIALREAAAVRSVKDVKAGDALEVVLLDGRIKTTVDETISGEAGENHG